MNDKSEQEKFAEFEQRIGEAYDAADGDYEFLAEEAGRIFAELGVPQEEAERIAKEVGEEFADAEERLSTEDGRQIYQAEILVEMSSKIVELKCMLLDYMRLSDTLFFGLLESAAKSPKHFSAWAKNTLDRINEENEQQEKNNG